MVRRNELREAAEIDEEFETADIVIAQVLEFGTRQVRPYLVPLAGLVVVLRIGIGFCANVSSFAVKSEALHLTVPVLQSAHTGRIIRRPPVIVSISPL